MGRKSLKNERRAEITRAFARVLAQHGYAGATIAAVAQEANMSPGLLHHHFTNKRDMLLELLTTLLTDFKTNVAGRNSGEPINLETYIDAALKLDGKSNTIAAKCWVGILAEGLREKALMNKIKQYLDSEVQNIEFLSAGALNVEKSSALISFILGALVFGAFAPRRTSGFAAVIGKQFLKTLEQT